MNLSTHFTLEELTVSDVAARNGWRNEPGASERSNLARLATLLEHVKVAVGNKPVIVNSGYRSKQVNDAVGSKDSSQHRLGCAADIRVPGMKPKEVAKACIDAEVPYDQIIIEFDSWVHISVPNDSDRQPRGSRLVINRHGVSMIA